jgi:hypothetical protein
MSLYVAPPNSAVGPDCGEGEIASLAQVDDVLARRVEQLGGFACGEQFVALALEDLVRDGATHYHSMDYKHQKRNIG